MKFRDLKHKKFYWYFGEVWYLDKDDEPPYWWDTYCESYVVNDEKGLRVYAHWEDDREYVWASGYEEFPYTWKELKKTIKEQRKDEKKYNDLHIWTGNCERCGCKLTPENYHTEQIYDNNQFRFDFERDLYYCNKCKQAQIDDYVSFCEKYEEEHKNERPMYI